MMSRCASETGQMCWPTRKASPGFQLVMGQPEQDSRTGAGMSQDESLRAGLAEDVALCFEALVAAYQDRLFSFALRVTGNREDAEEVAQDAFVRAYRALCTYPAERIRALSLRAWLYRITLNVARNRLRGKKPRLVSLDHPLSSHGETPWEAEDDPSSRPDARFEASRQRADIATLVGGLPRRYREPLVLRYIEGLRLDEVAKVLEQPLGTAKSNVHRGINALREAISESRREGVKK
ncbi:MAG: sigma-70 family RNA polymerase sigma factor [Acidobacteriota bacterium]